MSDLRTGQVGDAYSDGSDDGLLPRVSVLMPVYSQASFIRHALESLYAQSLVAWS